MTIEFNFSTRPFLGDPAIPVSQQVKETEECLRWVAASGVWPRVTFMHHWFAYPRIYLEPVLAIARLAAAVDTMRFMTNVVKPPIHNPAELAHQVATLDHMTNGRLDFGVGIGYPEKELEAVGSHRKERVPRFVESLKLMKLLWTGEEVTFRGRFWGVTHGRLGPTVLQKPHPPIWNAAQSVGAARRTARVADVLLMAPQATWESRRIMVREYRDEAAKQGKTPRIATNCNVCVAPDREKAMAEARVRVDDRGAYYRQWTMNEPTALDIVLTGDRDPREYAIVGTPDDCVETIQRYAEELQLTAMGINLINIPMGDFRAKMDYVYYVTDEVFRRVN